MISNETKLLAILAASMLTGCLGGCTLVPPKPEIEYRAGKTIDTGCSWTKLIRISKDDKLTQGTADLILEHDKAWVQKCSKSAPFPQGSPKGG